MRLTLLLLSFIVCVSSQNSSLQSDLEKIGKEFERAIKDVLENAKEHAVNETEGRPHRRFPVFNGTDFFNGSRKTRGVHLNHTEHGVTSGFRPSGGFSNRIHTTTASPSIFSEFWERIFGKSNSNNRTRVARSVEEFGEPEGSEESKEEESTTRARPTKRPLETRKPRGTAKPRLSRGTGKPPVPRGTGKPQGPRGTGKPLAPRATGKPQGPRGTSKPHGPRGTGKPQSSRGTGKPQIPRVTGKSHGSRRRHPTRRPHGTGRPARATTAIPAVTELQEVEATEE